MLLAIGVVAPLSAQTALVQHAPSVNGKIDGSVQQMTAEGVTLNSGANITGDLLVPGTPVVQMNGSPTYGGTLEGSGSASPSNYNLMLNSGAALRHVIRRTNAVTLPSVAAIAAPTGTVSVTVNTAGQSIAWSTLKNLTLNSNVGQITVPAGSYGNFSAGSSGGFKLGVAGAAQASVYNFQNLTLNSNSTLQVVGPVVINLANGFSANAPMGNSSNPAWLTLNIKSGGFTLNSGCNFYGYLVAPNGTIVINATTQLIGGVASAYLTVNGSGLLKLLSLQATNQSPTVSVTAPANGSSFQAPASFTLSAAASDSDGSVAKVEFFQGSTRIGQSTVAPYTFPVNSLGEGSYGFFARATDNSGATVDSAPVTVTVSCPNKPPVVALTSPANATKFNAPAVITLNATASDPDGSIAKVEFFQGTTLLGSDTTSPYSVNTSALSSGLYAFSAKAYDNAGATTTSSSASVTVINPNQPPAVSITAPANSSTFENPATFTVTANATDADGTVVLVEFFRNGVLQGSASQPPYQLAVSGLAVGIYDYKARATDNSGVAFDSAQVRVNVVHINHAPVAIAQSKTTTEDNPLSLILTGTDQDGDSLSYTIVTQPGHGLLAQGSQSDIFIYTPSPDFNGNDAFTFKVGDGSLQSASATVQIAVTAVNDPPVSHSSSVMLDENTSAAFGLVGTDVDNSALIFSIVSGPGHGALTGSLPNVVYTPLLNYNGSDSLVYTVSDGQLVSSPATISITITHVNFPPKVVLTAPVNTAAFIAPADFILQANGSDNDGTISRIEFFQNLIKIGEATAVPYQWVVSSLPPGSYSYTARATDNSNAVSNSTAITVTVAVNNPPVVALTAPVDGVTFIAPASITIDAAASDSDGTLAHVDFYQGSALIGQSLNAPYKFTTGALSKGTYLFFAKAYDNLGAFSATNPVTVTVVNSNQPPTISILSPLNGETVAGPAPFAIIAVADDSDGVVSKVEFFNGPTKIGESLTVPYQFSWAGVSSGSYILTARATDNQGATSVSSQIVVSVNEPPVANPLSVTVQENLPVAITLTGSDLETSVASLGFTVLTQPGHGTLSGTAPNLIYTSSEHYAGSDSFTFKVNDGIHDSTAADVSLSILPRQKNTLLVDAGTDQTLLVHRNHGSRNIVLNNDEWTFSDTGLSSAPTARNFALNIGRLFASGHPGRFLVYSANFGLAGAQLAHEMKNAGHDWDMAWPKLSLPWLQTYDGIFLCGLAADNQLLIDYVEAGGNVYLCVGTGAEDVQNSWGVFLHHFGLDLGPLIGLGGNIPITGSNPLLENVESLYYNNGNKVIITEPNNPRLTMLQQKDGNGLLALSAGSLATVLLHGTVSDESLPLPPNLVFTWSKQSGTGIVLFQNPGSLDTSAVFSEPGTYILRLTATDGTREIFDDIVITVLDNDAPFVDAGPDLKFLGNPQQVHLAGIVTDTDRQLPGQLRVVWTVVGGPGPVNFTDSLAATTEVSFTVPGIYNLKLSAFDGLDSASDEVEVRFGVVGVEPRGDLVAWWPANGNPHEMVRGNHDVEIHGGAGYAAGEVSQGFSFDGTYGYGRVAAHSDLDIGASLAGLTIELWANSDRQWNDQPLVSWGTNTTEGVSLGQNTASGTGLEMNLWDTAGVNHVISAGSIFTTNEWVHLAVTYDKAMGLARIFKNGVLIKEQILGVFTPQTSLPLTFGTSLSRHDYFRGVLDEISFYARPLGITEINAIYLAGAAGKTPENDNQAPVVNAGPDILMSNITGSATLAGSVIDDNKPFGLPTVLWTKREGSGSVIFANPSSEITTATFDVPGTYILELSASDGYAPRVSDLVEVRVGVHPVQPVPKLAAWWPANGHPREVIHGNHDMELYNGADYGLGHVSLGFTFDGLNDQGRVAAHSDLDIGASSGGLTIEFWANSGRQWNEQTLMSWGTSSVDGVCLRQNGAGGTGLEVNLRDTAGIDHFISAGSVFTTSEWVHIAVTYDKAMGSARIFRNGAIVNEQAAGFFTVQTSLPLTFGTSLSRAGYFQGVLDEISLYTGPLTTTEINAIYLAGVAGKAPPSNYPPVVNAGSDASTFANVTTTLLGDVSDDGLPNPPAMCTYAWSKISGPGHVYFSTPTALTTTATFDAPGIYTLRLSGSDSVLTGTDEVTITVEASPSSPLAVTLTAPVDNTVVAPDTAVSLSATASELSTSIVKVEFFDGVTKLGEDVTAPYSLTVSNGFSAGTHMLTAKAIISGGDSAVSAPSKLVVLSSLPPPPVLELSVPVSGAEITAPTNLVGTVSGQYLKSYEIQVRYKTAGGTAPWKNVVTRTNAVTHDVLGQLDPTLLLNGLYDIRLRATDQLDRIFNQLLPLNWVSVIGGMKIGANTSTFVDLTVPTSGLPLTVVRHYDSTDSRVGDFGLGTTLANREYSVQVSQRLGEDWYAYTVSGFQGLPQYIIDPAPPFDATGVEPEPRVVAITLPDNTTFRFSARLTPNHLYTEIGGGSIVFDPMPGTVGQLDAVNESTFEIENDVLSDSNFGFTSLLGVDDAEPLNPSAYRLTTLDGMQYIVSTTKGVLKVTDRNGNSTTYSPSRIARSDGAAIDLVRDAAGRITAVKDPSGQSVNYAYDLAGRLLTVTDREGRVTTYGYFEGTSLVTTIQEPFAILPEYDAYDAVGRLVSKVDGLLANGGIITERDLANRIEKHRDALGHITTAQYDEFGNVVRRTNALGFVTLYAFTDSRFRDKPTVVTDAEGNIIRYHFNAQGLVDTVTDANGHVTGYAYNANGQLLAETDALGRATAQTYDSKGNLLTRTDRMGNTTTFSYDATGNVLTEHSPLGNEIRYTYNSSGLPLTETEYGADNAPGRKRSYTYDSTGKNTSATSYRSDSQGTEVPVATRYEHNLNGQPTKTTYPDGTFSTKAYNPRGLLGSETDRSGNEVSYTYDNAGRLTRTTFADNSYEEKTYDAVGRVISERNVLGQIATNVYDDADHLLSINFPDIGTQRHTYDKVGRMLTDIDEGGRIITTAYDPVGNVTKIGYPDGTSTDLVYDEVDGLKTASARVFFAPSAVGIGYNPIPSGVDLGDPDSLAKYPASSPIASSANSTATALSRIKLPFGYHVEPANFTSSKLNGSHSSFGKLRARTAQASPTPPPTSEPHLYQYTYDANGRMKSITNPDGSLSIIEYDAVGRPTKTINELGQAWRYEYDPSTNDRARRTTVKGPSGYVESYLYGPLGDIEAAVDPIGNITEHHYNARNQCTDIKYSDARGALFTTEIFDDFDAEGNARHITDREGFETIIDDKRTQNKKSGDRVLTRKVGSVDYITSETYDEAGNLTRVVDPRGAITKYDYDYFNRRTLTTLPDGRIVQTEYGPRNRVEKVHEIASDSTDTHTTEYQYDNNDKVTKTIQSHKVAADSITVDSEYVADGRVKSISAPYLTSETPRNTSLMYDDVARVVTITDPMGRLSLRKQDKLGRLTDDTDTAGTTTHRDYDDLNRLTAITVTGQPDPVTGQSVTAKTTMTYDALGNVLSRIEAADTPEARTTRFSYKYQGNGTLLTTTFADGSTLESLQDTRGLVTSTTTPRGNTTTTKYDALGRPMEIAGPLGQKTTYAYPDLGESQVATDALGRVVTRKFDLSQRLIEEKLPGTFGQRTYTYDSFSKLKTTKNTRGYATTMEYDFMGRPAKVTRPDTTAIAATYTAVGQPRHITDARGIVTQYDYDSALHHLISVTAAEGNTKARTTAYGYDAADRVNQVTAPNGQVTDSVFDALGRLTKRTASLDSDGNKYTESFTYYQTGELKVHADIRGDTTHAYDVIGHLKTLTNPLNQVTKTDYDSEGNLTQTTDALDRVTAYTYDALGRILKTTLPQSATETNGYDAYHLLQSALAPTTGGGVPIVTEYGYDDLDHITTTTRHLSPDNVVESRAYDGEGNLEKATNAAGFATNYKYNSLDQLKSITQPDTSTESFTYDGQGNRLTHERLPIPDNHTYTYTPHREIETITDALGHATSYAYDDAGNQLTATDAVGRVTTNEYDYANRLRKVTLPGNRVSTFDHDTVGNRIAVTDPANRTKRFEYDSLGRLKRALTPLYNAMSATAANHSDPSGSMVEIAGQKFAASQLTYDPVGNLETLTDPNNHATRFKYDAGNRLTHTYLPAAPSTAYETNTYDYAGRRTARADADGATTLYGYDALSRLMSVQPSATRIGALVNYVYDPRGLRKSMTDGLGTTTYTYDDRGRLHTEQTPYAGRLTYTHDELGRLINQRSSNVGGVNTTYGYDDASRLTDVTDVLRSETSVYDYNHADQLTRVAQPNGTVTTQIYDTAGRPDTTTTVRGFSSLFFQQYAYTSTDQVDTVATTINRPAPFLPVHNVAGYTYDSSDRLLREIHVGDSINGQIDYTLDPAGNRTARSSNIASVGAQSFIYDANNALASLFTYDVRGNPTTGSLFPGSFSDTYDYLDHQADRAGKVEYIYDGDGRRVGHRSFDPVSGRWTSHTRLISSLNPTGYEQEVEEFADGVMTSSYTIGRSRLAGQRFVDEATTALGLTIALGADGKVYVWGNGQSTPTIVPGLAKIIAVGAGASHYLALGADGKVYSWGTSNGSGQLGRSGDISTPTAIPGLSDVAAISTQLDHTLALTINGTIYAWGDNSSGQLGDGTTTNRGMPVSVATGAVSIAAGQVHSYALMLDGKAEAWGDNTYGQLGQAGALPVLTPTTIPGMTGVSEIAAGAFHALALKADGTLVTWGDNTFGQLGDPAALPSRGTPTMVTGVSGLTAIAAGARHSLALQSDGTLLAWGENRSGQLGTAYPANLYTPTAVPGLNNLTHLAAGARSSYATTAAGATYVMGANRTGQLGTGNTANTSTPQLLPAGTNPAFATIASGGESGASHTSQAIGLRDQFFAPDAHEHTRLLTDVTGATTQTYSYDAFGNILNASDSSGYSLPATRYPLLTATNPYLYRGERLETETGRYHLRARDYDATLGRLATLDTYVGDAESPMSLNRYAYTEANPVGNADPTGHFSLSVWELLGQMDEINRQWDEIKSVGRQEEFDPEQAYNNFRNAIAGIPSDSLTITKKERSVWMNASRQGGLIGSLAGESGGVLTEKNGIKGYADGSDVFFHANANPRHRLSTIERTVEQAWASAYNLRNTINTGLPITSTDPKAWQTRWPAHLYHDAMLQAQLRSQMIEGPVEARFTLSLNRKLYNHARVALTASAVKNLSAAQSGGLLDWQSAGQPGTQGIDASFLRSVKSTGFAGAGQGELFARNLIFGRDKIIKDAARPLGVLQAVGSAAEISAGYALAIPSLGTSLVFTAHGADHLATSIGQAYSGDYLTTTTQDALTPLVGEKAASYIDLAASFGFSAPEAVFGGLRLATNTVRETAILGRNVTALGAEALGDFAANTSNTFARTTAKIGRNLGNELGYQFENLAYKYHGTMGSDLFGRAFAVDPSKALRIGESELGRLQSKFVKLAEDHLLPKYRALDPNLDAGYTGSFKTGTVGNVNKPTFGQPINLSEFDIDYWIESDTLHKKFGSNLRADVEFRDILSRAPGFGGLKPNKKGFSILFRPTSK